MRYVVEVYRANRVVIRVDSSYEIGTGHVMRDLVLAKRFKGAEVWFAVRELKGNINFRIVKEGHSIVSLKSSSVEEMIQVVLDLNADTVVVDNYGIGMDYEKRLKKATGAKLFVVDDMYRKHYCDVLLNHNIHALSERYKGLVPEWCTVLCGKEHTLLRDEFYVEKEKHKSRSPLHEGLVAFVFLGGSDVFNLTLRVLKVIDEIGDIKCHVVTTSANRNVRRLLEYAGKNPWIDLHIDSNRVAELMRESDFAVVSSSTIVNEVVFMELPFVAIKTAPNQEEMYRFLRRSGFPAMGRFEEYDLKRRVLEIINGVG